MALSTTYTKTETDFLIQQLEKKTASGYKGDLIKTDAAPTQIGLYGLLETGVYTNLGGIDAQSGKLNFASFDGTTWSLIAVNIESNLSNYVKKYDVKEIVGIEKGVNLADLSKIQNGYYYSYASGIKIANSGYSALGLIEIEPNTEYQVPNTYTDQTAFFDENENYISGIAIVDLTTNKFITPSYAKYVGLSLKPENVSSFILAKSSEYPLHYIPYVEELKNVVIEPEQVKNLFQKIRTDLGIYNINIIDTSLYEEGKFPNYLTGQLNTLAGFGVAGRYEIEPKTEYKASPWYTDQFAFYDGQDQFISGLAEVFSTGGLFTTPENAKFVRFTVKPEQINNLVVSKKENFPNEYVPYGVSIKNLVTENESITEVVVSPNENDLEAQFKGKNAIQEAIDSITDASSTNRYRIVVKQGLYKITQANEYIGNIGYPAMVCPKDYVDIVGQGEDNTIVWAELPYDDAEIGASIDGQVYDRNRYQTLYHYAGNMVIKDLTFVAKNLRYVNHIDDGRGTDKKRDFENVSFVFQGNKGTLKPLGTGTSQGEETHIKGGKSITDWGEPFASHNNSKFKKPSRWSFHNHVFSSMGMNLAMEIQNDGSLLQDTIELVGCSFEGLSYRINYVDVWLKGNIAQKFDSFNHAEWHFSGHGNKPFLFDNNIMNGKSLRIKSNSTGTNSKVRFNKNSSAYPLLIQNTQGNSDKSLFLKSREYVDGYIVQDGTVGLNGIAYGCKDLSDAAYAYDNGVNYTSLGKRLGDCSTTNKSLQIIIDGVTKTVTFNKNYTAMTNAQIIAEINTAINGAGVASLYIYGRDYYPELPDVLERVYNFSYTTFIPKGTIVTKVSGKVKPANEGDIIAGVALDDIPVLSIDSEGVLKGQGRMMKKGLISTNQSQAFFVIADNQNPSIGTKFKVVNGQLVTDVNGNIVVSVDDGVVSINC